MTEAGSGISGAQLTAKQLRAEGIDCIFGIPAAPTSDILVAALREGIRVVGCRHEEQAGFMAQAYGYITKKPGVLVVGSGPGMTNAITSMHVAQESCWPLVTLGGSVNAVWRGLGGFQEADQVAAAKPVCKWAVQADSVPRIPEYVHLALGKALSGRPGAVYLDFPGQLIHDTIPEESVRLRAAQPEPRRPYPDPEAIRQIADMLATAQRPLVLIGKGAAWSDASQPLCRLVSLGLPFVASPLGRGTIPDDDPRCVGAARSSALKRADAILMIGGRFNWMFLASQGYFAVGGVGGPDVRIAQIDVEPEEMYSGVTVDIGVTADAAVATDALCDTLSGRSLRSAATGWLEELRAEVIRNQASLKEQMDSDSTPINHFRLWRDVRDSLDRDATVVVDGETNLGVGRMVMPSYYPRHRLNPGTTSCIGVGVPFAVAAKIARPDKQVVAVLGDYAFGTSFTEIETAARNGVNVVFVVNNNSGIGGHHSQKTRFRPEDPMVYALLPARYEKMAEMVGGYGELVENPAQIKPALQRAFAAGTVAIINVMTDPLGTYRRHTVIVF
ncbi:MAG: thiamine pyrophosphate-binding protein [Chloroflexi bacterium]|nr:thiamine pyrophosphate-binding protein [Chloroflexota bacterium]